jgi:excisionase family DNA binding protein
MTVSQPEGYIRRRYISILEAAEYCGTSHKTIRRRIASGDLKAYRLGDTRVIRIDVADLDRLLHPIPRPAATTGGGPRDPRQARRAPRRRSTLRKTR